MVEAGGFLYDSDAYADELPYWVEVGGEQHLVHPARSTRTTSSSCSRTASSPPTTFRAYLIDSLDELCAEGGDALSWSGFTAGSSGDPVVPRGWRRFLEHVAAQRRCVGRGRADIARHWRAEHPSRKECRTMRDDEAVRAALATIFDADTCIYRERGFQRRVGFGQRPALVHIDLGERLDAPGACVSCAGWRRSSRPCRRSDEAGNRANGIPIAYTTTAYEDVYGPNSDMGLWVHKIPWST